MSRKEQIPQANEPIEPADFMQSPKETGVEPITPAPDQSAPRQLSEDERHRREEIIHDFQVVRRLGKLGLTIAERRAIKKVVPRGRIPRNSGNKQGRNKPLAKPAKNLREEE